MKYYRLLPFLFAIFVLLISNIQAGAWTQKEGSYYLKLETMYLKTFKEFDYKGNKKNILQDRFIYKNASFRDISLRAYGEYGLLNSLTLIGKIPFKVYTTDYFLNDLYSKSKISKNTIGLGDLDLGLKYALIDRPVVLAVQGGVKIPLGYEKQPENFGPTLGTAEVDFDGQILLGQSFYPLALYASAGLGYRVKGGRLNDEIFYFFETGYSWQDWFFKIYFNGIKNIDEIPDLYGGEIQLPLSGGGGATPDLLYGNLDLDQISFTLSREIKKGMSVEASVYHILSGKNTISGQTFSLGLSVYK